MAVKLPQLGVAFQFTRKVPNFVTKPDGHHRAFSCHLPAGNVLAGSLFLPLGKEYPSGLPGNT